MHTDLVTPVLHLCGPGGQFLSKYHATQYPERVISTAVGIAHRLAHIVAPTAYTKY